VRGVEVVVELVHVLVPVHVGGAVRAGIAVHVGA
jgi:hypothetical protein